MFSTENCLDSAAAIPQITAQQLNSSWCKCLLWHLPTPDGHNTRSRRFTGSSEMRPLPLSPIPNQQSPVPALPYIAGRAGAGNRGHARTGNRAAVPQQPARTPAAGIVDSVVTAPEWAQPTATGATHERAADLRLKNREREGHADAFVAGAAGACPRGHRPRPAQWRRTHTPGGDPRADRRQLYSRDVAVSFEAERDAAQ